MSSSRGRRPGSPDTRAQILASARELFAARGFQGASIRSIAAQASVDPALVHHYFGAKEDLFIAALEVGVDPRVALRPVVEGGVDGAGARLMRTLLSVWDDPETRLPLLAVVRGIGDEAGQRLLRDGLTGLILGPVGAGLGIDEPDRRMSLVASQLIGVVLLRYVLAAEPLTSMPAESVVALVAPTIQRYLSDPL